MTAAASDPKTHFADLEAKREEIASTPRKAIVQYHLHKTGGTSIKHAFLDKFKSTAFEVSTLSDIAAFQKNVENGALDADKPYFIYGHRSKDVVEFLKDRIPVFSFTIIRRPLDMFSSNFSYRHTRHGMTDLDTKTFLNQYPRNNTHFFLGFTDIKDAVSRSAETFTYVGVTEALGEALSILAYLFDLKPKIFPSRNITKPDDYVDIDIEEIPEFVKRHGDDIAYYEYILALHNRLISGLKEHNIPLLSFQENEKRSYHTPVTVNLDLENNNDKVSLFLSGREIWGRDVGSAKRFMDKSFDLDWAMAPRIYRFMLTKTVTYANKWLDGKIEMLRAKGDEPAIKMIEELEKLREKSKPQPAKTKKRV